MVPEHCVSLTEKQKRFNNEGLAVKLTHSSFLYLLFQISLPPLVEFEMEGMGGGGGRGLGGGGGRVGVWRLGRSILCVFHT